jgi:hypothetical protein
MAKRGRTDTATSQESVIVSTAEAAGRTVGRAVKATMAAVDGAMRRTISRKKSGGAKRRASSKTATQKAKTKRGR